MILNTTGQIYRNLKSSIHHNYLVEYEKYFEFIKGKVKTVLELGVLGGSSLKIWSDYFLNAIIYGIDDDPKCKKLEKVLGDRVKIFIGRQEDVKFLIDVWEQVTREFDIIIDDCGHVLEEQKISFDFLVHYLADGGYYFIEDVFEGGQNRILEMFEEQNKCFNIYTSFKLEILPVYKGNIGQYLMGVKKVIK